MNLIAVFAVLALVPQPREIRETGGLCPSNAPVAFARDAALPAEGYRISVKSDGVTVASADDAGEFYARETLKQLVGPKGSMPCCEISDSPSW